MTNKSVISFLFLNTASASLLTYAIRDIAQYLGELTNEVKKKVTAQTKTLPVFVENSKYDTIGILLKRNRKK